MPEAENRTSLDLTGRVVLVTGASSGLGHRFARVAAKHGAKVVAAARRIDQLRQLQEEVEGQGSALMPVRLDVGDEASVIAGYDAAEERFGTVDTVVANAGVHIEGSALKLSAEDFDRTSSVNFRGVFLTAREGARRMIAADSAGRGNGRVVLVSSITAQQATMGAAVYAASKAAVVQLGRSLAKEWARKGISVNTICPGYVETDLNQHVWAQAGGKALLGSFPRRRIMEASSLDAMMLYLCSDAAGQVTGSVFTVDDGQTL